MLLSLFHIEHDSAGSDHLTRLEEGIRELGLSLPEYVPILAPLLSIAISDQYPISVVTPALQKERLLNVVASLFAGVALGPTLLIIEDAHWIDESSLELVTRLGQVALSSPLLLVVTRRSDVGPAQFKLASARRLFVDRLSDPLSASLVDQISGEQSLPRTIVEQIVVRADGVPLFIEELTALILTKWNHGHRALETLSSAEIPGTLYELLVAKLDRLDRNAREVAQFCAVLGKSFSSELLTACSRDIGLEVEGGVQELVEHGILATDRSLEVSFHFRHSLIQEAGYQSVIKTQRRKWHRKIADAIAQTFPHVTSSQPELLAHHRFEASELDDAVALWFRAGELASRRWANDEAVKHFSAAVRALLLQPKSPERDINELRVQTSMGAALMSTSGFGADEVEQAFARAHQLCEQSKDKLSLVPVIRGLGFYYLVRADLVKSCNVAEQIRDLGLDLRDSGAEMVGQRLLGATKFVTGQLGASIELFEKVNTFYSAETGSQLTSLHELHPQMGALSWLLWAKWCAGFIDQAFAAEEGLRKLIETVGHPDSVAFAQGYRAAFHQMVGDPVRTRQIAEEAIALCSEQRLSMWLAWASLLNGWALVQLGSDCGLEELRRGLDAWKSIGCRLGIPYGLGLLADAALRVGEFELGLRSIGDALRMVDDTGDRYYEPELLRLRGELLLKQGSLTEAELNFRQAIEMSRARRNLSLELRAALSLVRCVGPSRESKLVVDAAYAQFTEGFQTPDLVEARKLVFA